MEFTAKPRNQPKIKISIKKKYIFFSTKEDEEEHQITKQEPNLINIERRRHGSRPLENRSATQKQSLDRRTTTMNPKPNSSLILTSSPPTRLLPVPPTLPLLHRARFQFHSDEISIRFACAIEEKRLEMRRRRRLGGYIGRAKPGAEDFMEEWKPETAPFEPLLFITVEYSLFFFFIYTLVKTNN